MNLLPDNLMRAAADARERLSDYARKTATAQLNGDFSSTQASMAQTAKAAIFADALLQALRSRCEELKTVSKA